MNDISEVELRAMIRESIARHLGAHDASGPPPPHPQVDLDRRHASFMLFPLSRGEDAAGGACLIEPAVRCTHCGFCQSYGH